MASTACAPTASTTWRRRPTSRRPRRWRRPASSGRWPPSGLPRVVPRPRAEADHGHVLPAEPGLHGEHAPVLLVADGDLLAVGPLVGVGDRADLDAHVPVGEADDAV